MENFEEVLKMIGCVSPVGDQARADTAFENLKELTKLTGRLIDYIDEMAICHVNSNDPNRHRAGKHCVYFLSRFQVGE